MAIDWPTPALAPVSRHQHGDPVAGLLRRQVRAGPLGLGCSTRGGGSGGGSGRGLGHELAAGQRQAEQGRRGEAEERAPRLRGMGLLCHDPDPHERRLPPRPLHRRDADRQSFRSSPARRRGAGRRRPDRGRGQPGHGQAASPYRREAADARLSRPQCRPGPARAARADARTRRWPWSRTPARRSSPIPATSWCARRAPPASPSPPSRALRRRSPR